LLFIIYIYIFFLKKNPTDSLNIFPVTNWDEYKNFIPKGPTGHVVDTEASVDDIVSQMKKIRGNLVNFPIQFLKNENLMGSVISNAVTPDEIFT